MSPEDIYKKNILGGGISGCVWEWLVLCRSGEDTALWYGGVGEGGYMYWWRWRESRPFQSLEQLFLHFCTSDILSWIIHCGCCPVHCRLFNGIPGLDLLLDASGIPPPQR